MNGSKALEGIVLDSEGAVLSVPESLGQDRQGSAFRVSNGRVHFKVYRGAWWLPLALGVGIPAFFVLGIFLFTALMTVGIAWMLLGSLLPRRTPGRR